MAKKATTATITSIDCFELRSHNRQTTKPNKFAVWAMVYRSLCVCICHLFYFYFYFYFFFLIFASLSFSSVHPHWIMKRYDTKQQKQRKKSSAHKNRFYLFVWRVSLLAVKYRTIPLSWFCCVYWFVDFDACECLCVLFIHTVVICLLCWVYEFSFITYAAYDETVSTKQNGFI